MFMVALLGNHKDEHATLLLMYLLQFIFNDLSTIF